MTTALHERIADDLRYKIAHGELAVGDPLPSEAQLQETWHGSRAPVRQALAALRAEGLIGGGPGKPPVVRRASLAQSFATLLSFSRWVETLGSEPGQQTVECALRPAGADVAGMLELQTGALVVEVLRLRLIDGRATMVERTTFRAEQGRQLFSHDLDAGSIYEILVSSGVRLGPARHVIDAVGADTEDARLLGIDFGAPLLRERRLACTEDGVPFEYSDDRYRPELVSFTIETSPQANPAPVRTWSSGTGAAFPLAHPHEAQPNEEAGR